MCIPDVGVERPATDADVHPCDGENQLYSSKSMGAVSQGMLLDKKSRYTTTCLDQLRLEQEHYLLRTGTCMAEALRQAGEAILMPPDALLRMWCVSPRQIGIKAKWHTNIL